MHDAIESTRIVDPADRPETTALDRAKDPNRLSLKRITEILRDAQWEPPWRRAADIAVDYYDSNQLDRETLEDLEDRGLGPLQRNIIKPTIDAVLGLEERTKTDWRVTSDYDEEADLCDALSAKLSEAERETGADTAISNGYAGQIKAGFAAIEVSRSSNPFNYRYRVKYVHRREIWWDPRSRENDWSDARYVRRRRWVDADHAGAFFPAHRDLIIHVSQGWTDWDSDLLASSHEVETLATARDAERGYSFDDLEWRDAERGRVAVDEVWYRVFIRGHILRLPRGRVLEYNPANPRHMVLVKSGAVRPEPAVYDKLRCAYFVGPHRLADFATDRRYFPYVPMWGFREDLTGAPYGMIRSMISTQDEINARLAKMMWLLSARRTLIDSDALAEKFNDMNFAQAELGRSDAFIVLNPSRLNRQGAVTVDDNLQLAEAQRMALMDAVQSMQSVSGVFPAMMGQTGSVTAARAIDKLVDQGTNTLAEINGNYLWARREVGNRLLDLVREDLKSEEIVNVDTGTSKRKVYINRRVVDPDSGVEVLENGVANSRARVTLADVPSTPSYREQQFGQLAEINKSLPPEIQAIVTPFILEGSNLAKRKEIAKLIRDRLGVFDDKSPEGKAAAEEAKAAAAAEAEQLAKQFDAQLREQLAKADKLQAEAEKVRAEIGAAGGEQIEALRQEYEQRVNELNQKLISLEMDREIERYKIDRDTETKMAAAKAQTERESIKSESSERVAQGNRVADDAVQKVRDQITDLSEEVDDRLAEIMKALKEQKEESRTPKK